MKSGDQRLLEILLREFIKELTASNKCSCNECLGGYINEFLRRLNPQLEFP